MASERKEALYRKVVRKTWRKRKFRDLNGDLKLILLYLWTSPDSTNPGIYYISIPTVADDLGHHADMVTASFHALIKDGWFMYDFEERVIFFPKWSEYDPPFNDSVVKSYISWAKELPKTVLTNYYLWTLKPYSDQYGITLPHDDGMMPALCPPSCPPSDSDSSSNSDTQIPAAPVFEKTDNSESELEQLRSKAKELDRLQRHKNIDAMGFWLANHFNIPLTSAKMKAATIYNQLEDYSPSKDMCIWILENHYRHCENPVHILNLMNKKGSDLGAEISEARRAVTSTEPKRIGEADSGRVAGGE
mgnify:CR=1 FL=1